MSSRLAFVRWTASILAFVTLVGGYFAHQIATMFIGFEEYQARVESPNFALGWVLLLLAAFLSLVRETEATEE